MLRHKGVFGEMGAVDRSVEATAVLRRFPDPVKVEFRRDGDMGAVMNTIKSNRFVEIGAAVGAGKSTKVPLMLSKALGCLVIHTIPFSIAAQYLAAYLAGTVDGDKFVYMDDLHSDMPAHGVVLMSTPFFHARRAYDAFVGVENAVLYLDESHESDGWTASLRTLAPAITSFRCVVKASATNAPGVQMAPTLPSKREVRTYKRVDVSTWSATDRGVPWGATGIQDNVMLCIDREATRRHLAEQYEEHGFIVRDCSKQDYAYFSETMRMAKDPRQGIVVVLVDYKYRSSFSIPGINTFVDSCEVAIPTVEGGMPKMVYRQAYDFEIQQFLGRGARVPGTPAVVWRTDDQARKLMCDLESLECDAANLLYRMMGFRPPLDLIEYPFFKGDVPIDLAAAMASEHPLQLCPAESRVPWVNGHKALLLEKERAAFEYDKNVRSRAKAVSCHTIADVERPSSPPPDVPRAYRSLRVDVDGLDEYRSSRDSSPCSVFTLDTTTYDHIDAIRDANAVRPKRVAKRVLEARAAEEKLRERKKAEDRLSGAVSPLTANVIKLPDLPVVLDEPLVLRDKAALVQDRSASQSRGFRALDDSIGPVRVALEQRQISGPAVENGKYYHYHGMERAPVRSTTFVRGVDSVVSFCEGRAAKLYVKGLSDDERLCAMRMLVDAANDATAVAVGIQRLFTEVSGRPPEEWQSIVDHAAMLDEVEWMSAQCGEQQAKVRVYHTLIPLFAKYELDEVPPPLELEQRVMMSVMERFERVAVKKDPDKAKQYLLRLNGRSIALGPRMQDRYRRAEIMHGN